MQKPWGFNQASFFNCSSTTVEEFHKLYRPLVIGVYLVYTDYLTHTHVALASHISKYPARGWPVSCFIGNVD